MRFILGVFALLLWATSATATCRQALALGLDVSGSVDENEYRIQIKGLANALQHPEVRDALLVLPQSPVSLAIFEWSGPDLKRIVQNWVVIDSAATLDQVADNLRGIERVKGDPSTAIGSAMTFGVHLLQNQRTCWKRTLDLSGDGKSNTGPRPQDSKSLAEISDVTINGLVIGAFGSDSPAQQRDELAKLWSYYSAYVATGPGAFVESALGFADFEAAMVRKLKRELQGQLFAQR